MKITIFDLRKNMSNETLVKQIENYYKKMDKETEVITYNL
jgi:hypothetical protein